MQSRYGKQLMQANLTARHSVSLPRVLLTLGDVAGVGPEIICRAWTSGALHGLCRPVVVGNVGRLRQVVSWLDLPCEVVAWTAADGWVSDPNAIRCLEASVTDLADVPLGQIDARAGRAAWAFLTTAVQHILHGEADAMVTAPLNKKALHLAGFSYPGQTEILAEQTGTRDYAMMLYGEGIGIVHVTLHMGLRDVFAHLTVDNVLAKIRLAHAFLQHLHGVKPKIAVCALNPHAGEEGAFGDEEPRVIAPAIARAAAESIGVSGPWPADTLFSRARRGEFEGIVAMYHDQGHIPMKLLAGLTAVNVSLGLPLIRTSVAHGTAFDIAAAFRADPASLVEAARLAARLFARRTAPKLALATAEH
jgi:4-hydroxythreonine-4-phosphate dehydrogenase